MVGRRRMSRGRRISQSRQLVSSLISGGGLGSEPLENRLLLTTLYWQGDVDQQWSTPGNWTTNSSTGSFSSLTPANGDTLIFDSATTTPSPLLNYTSNADISRTNIKIQINDRVADANNFVITSNPSGVIIGLKSGFNFDSLGNPHPAILNSSLDGTTASIQIITLKNSGLLVIANNSGTLNVTSNIQETGQVFVTRTDDDTNVPVTVLSGVISGSSAQLNKDGNGTLTLSGMNTYAGPTFVTGGTLLINGSTSATSAVIVADAGTLGGTGTANGSVTVESGGTIAPGTSPGVLTNASIDFASDSTFSLEIGGTTPGTGAGKHDQLVITSSTAGAVMIDSGAVLSMTAFDNGSSTTFVPSAGDTFVIIDNSGTSSVVGNFFGLVQGGHISNFIGSGLRAYISYTGGDGNDVVITVNSAPVVNADKTVTVNEEAQDTTLSITAPTDVDLDTLTITVTEIPTATKGTVTKSDGTVLAVGNVLTSAELTGLLFDTVADANGAAGTFSYSVSDGALTSSQVVTLSINPVADIMDDSASTDEDMAVTVSVLGNDTFENSGKTVTGVGSASNGTVTTNGTTVTYTPTADFNGSDSFTSTVTSGGVTETATVSITINPVNDYTPVANADSIAVAEGGTATVLVSAATSVLDNDTDADLPPNTLTVAAVNGSALNVGTAIATPHGTLTLNTDGSFSYTHDGSENFTDSFTYTVFDGLNTSSAATVSITITAVNDAPVVTLSGVSSADEGQTKHYTFTTNDSDGGTYSFVVLSPSGGSVGTVTNATIDSVGAGSFDVTFSDGPATSVVSVQISDGGTDSNVSSISVTVNNVEPTISISGLTTANVGTAYTLTLNAVTDPGVDTVTSYIVHWGDGNSDTYSTLAPVKTHTYTAEGSVNITVDLVDGDGTFLDQANALTVTVAEPLVHRYDFNSVAGDASDDGTDPSDTQSDLNFIGVKGDKLFSDGNDYGFVTAVDSISRTAASVTTKTSKDLYKDFVRGYAAGTFQVSVPVDQVYNLRFYSGDTGAAHDHLRITIEGGGVAGYAKTASPTDNLASTPTILAFTTVSFTNIQDLNDDGILTIAFSDLTNNASGEAARWVVNGFDMWWVDTDGNAGTDLNAPGVAPLISENTAATVSNAVGLTNAALAPIVREAIARWSATGLTAAQVAMLKAVTFQVTDLDAQHQLGLASEAEGRIQLDDNANGHGWFVDRTPRDNREFTGRNLLTALPTGPASGRMDLLTVVMHEMGHILGRDHTANPQSLMAKELSAGQRYLPVRETPTLPSIGVRSGDVTSKKSLVTTPAATVSKLETTNSTAKSQLSANQLTSDDTLLVVNHRKRNHDLDLTFANFNRIFEGLENLRK